MLRNINDDSIDLVEEKWRIEEILPSDLSNYITDSEDVLAINYPVEVYPEKVISMSFDKTPIISGILTGIRGQYLFFEDGQVLNIRRHTSYQIEFDEIS